MVKITADSENDVKEFKEHELLIIDNVEYIRRDKVKQMIDKWTNIIKNENNHYLTPQEARKITLNNIKEQITLDYEIKEVLEQIRKKAELGNYILEIYFDKKIREKLIILGYEVSESWKERGFYKSEMMTISWY